MSIPARRIKKREIRRKVQILEIRSQLPKPKIPLKHFSKVSKPNKYVVGKVYINKSQNIERVDENDS